MGYFCGVCDVVLMLEVCVFVVLLVWVVLCLVCLWCVVLSDVVVVD